MNRIKKYVIVIVIFSSSNIVFSQSLENKYKEQIYLIEKRNEKLLSDRNKLENIRNALQDTFMYYKMIYEIKNNEIEKLKQELVKLQHENKRMVVELNSLEPKSNEFIYDSLIQRLIREKYITYDSIK